MRRDLHALQFLHELRSFIALVSAERDFATWVNRCPGLLSISHHVLIELKGNDSGTFSGGIWCVGSCRRTVSRWIAFYRLTPQTSALLPRVRGIPVEVYRINAYLDQLIAQVIREVYPTKVRAKKKRSCG